MLVDMLGFGKLVGGHQARHSDWLASVAWLWLDNETLNYFGIRFWEVGAWIELEEGRVQTVHTQVFVEGPGHKWLDAGWNYGPSIPDRVQDLPAFSDSDTPNLVATSHFLHWGIENGRGIEAWITKEATLEERRVAFGFNLDCLTRMGGCATMCEFVPRLVRHENPDKCR
jgi:hypothetical protein